MGSCGALRGEDHGVGGALSNNFSQHTPGPIPASWTYSASHGGPDIRDPHSFLVHLFKTVFPRPAVLPSNWNTISVGVEAEQECSRRAWSSVIGRYATQAKKPRRISNRRRLKGERQDDQFHPQPVAGQCVCPASPEPDCCQRNSSSRFPRSWRTTTGRSQDCVPHCFCILIIVCFKILSPRFSKEGKWGIRLKSVRTRDRRRNRQNMATGSGASEAQMVCSATVIRANGRPERCRNPIFRSSNARPVYGRNLSSRCEGACCDARGAQPTRRRVDSHGCGWGFKTRRTRESLMRNLECDSREDDRASRWRPLSRATYSVREATYHLKIISIDVYTCTPSYLGSASNWYKEKARDAPRGLARPADAIIVVIFKINCITPLYYEASRTVIRALVFLSDLVECSRTAEAPVGAGMHRLVVLYLQANIGSRSTAFADLAAIHNYAHMASTVSKSTIGTRALLVLFTARRESCARNTFVPSRFANDHKKSRYRASAMLNILYAHRGFWEWTG